MKPLNIAHRGGAALSPENTLTAFGRAMGMGADGVELDVQLSRDGVVVVHHDYRLNPGYACLRGGDWSNGELPKIKDLTLGELRQYNIGVRRPGSTYACKHPLVEDADGEEIPTLEKAVRVSKIYPHYEMMIELKCDTSDDSADPVALADAAYDVVAAADFLPHTIFVGFDWRALLRVKQRAPDATCWFTSDVMAGDVRPVIDGIAASSADGWFPHFANATEEAVSHARGQGLKVGAWTINDPADMHRLSGLDALCTDRPDLLGNFLRA